MKLGILVRMEITKIARSNLRWWIFLIPPFFVMAQGYALAQLDMTRLDLFTSDEFRRLALSGLLGPWSSVILPVFIVAGGTEIVNVERTPGRWHFLLLHPVSVTVIITAKVVAVFGMLWLMGGLMSLAYVVTVAVLAGAPSFPLPGVGEFTLVVGLTCMASLPALVVQVGIALGARSLSGGWMGGVAFLLMGYWFQGVLRVDFAEYYPSLLPLSVVNAADQGMVGALSLLSGLVLLGVGAVTLRNKGTGWIVEQHTNL